MGNLQTVRQPQLQVHIQYLCMRQLPGIEHVAGGDNTNARGARSEWTGTRPLLGVCGLASEAATPTGGDLPIRDASRLMAHLEGSLRQTTIPAEPDGADAMWGDEFGS